MNKTIDIFKKNNTNSKNTNKITKTLTQMENQIRQKNYFKY